MTLTQGSLRLLPLLRTLKVLDKNGNIVPFEPNWAQLRIIQQIEDDWAAGKATRIIVLKARQIGISTVIEAILFIICTLFENSEAVVASLDTEQAEYLFGMTKRYYDEWAFKKLYPTRYSSKRQMTLEGLNSEINVKTGENPKSFRGRTYRAAHLSEIAFWTKPIEAMTSINQGMPSIQGNMQFIESTANGIGNHFEEEYWRAKEGKSDYVAFFFPWFLHYEYIPCRSRDCRDGTCKTCVEVSKKMGKLTKEERDLELLGASRAHLAWRRWAIPNLCLNNLDIFHQEYPSTDKEAFISSGVNAFPENLLLEVYDRQEPAYGRFVATSGEVRFVADLEGPWALFKQPDTQTVKGEFRSEYFIGADPSFGIVDGDFSAAHVINRRTKEQVARFHGKVSAGPFADELAMAGKYYNTATIACEEEGSGLKTIERLRWIYPKQWMWRNPTQQLGTDIQPNSLGWSTNWKSKAWMILELSEAVEKGNLLIHDEKTFKEMRTYQFFGASGFVDMFGPADKDRGHDDLVMSLAIAIVCEGQESPLDAYEVAKPPPGWEDEDG